MKKKVLCSICIGAVLSLCGCSFSNSVEELYEHYIEAPSQVADRAEISPETSPTQEPLPTAVETPEPTPVQPTEDMSSRYHYGRLSENAKQLYLQLLNGIRSYEERFTVDATGSEQIQAVFQAVLADYPELFYVDGDSSIWTINNGAYFEFAPKYNMAQADIPATASRYETIADTWIAECGQTADHYELARKLFERLIQETDYEIGCADSQNMKSVFDNKVSVCAGYAKAYQYMLNRAGIPAMYITGIAGADQREHAWNMIQLENGNYYLCDVTWGEVSYEGNEGEVSFQGESILYDYFCLPQEPFNRSHQITDGYEYPNAEDSSYDYYIRSGMYMESYDQDQFLQKIWDSVNAGDSMTAMKFGSIEALNQALSAIDEGDILEGPARQIMEWNGVSNYSYYQYHNDTLYILKIYW